MLDSDWSSAAAVVCAWRAQRALGAFLKRAARVFHLEAHAMRERLGRRLDEGRALIAPHSLSLV